MPTKYLVLSKDDNGWKEVGTAEAVSADAAIRDYVGRDSAEGPLNRVIVAIPARSWKPRKVTVESMPRLKLS